MKCHREPEAEVVRRFIAVWPEAWGASLRSTSLDTETHGTAYFRSHHSVSCTPANRSSSTPSVYLLLNVLTRGRARMIYPALLFFLKILERNKRSNFPGTKQFIPHNSKRLTACRLLWQETEKVSRQTPSVKNKSQSARSSVRAALKSTRSISNLLYSYLFSKYSHQKYY